MAGLIEAFCSQTENCTGFGGMTLISETGFDDGHEDARFFPTGYILKVAGVENQFHTKPPDDADRML
jgi:hypothetical protein